MIFKITYHYLVAKDDIPRLSSVWKKNIHNAIKSKLTVKPNVYGKPLRQSLKNYCKLRVGDYRVIFRIDGNIIKVFAIQHRSIVYSAVEKRIGF